jgi:hypothetical protein
MRRLTKRRFADAYRKYTSNWALWKVTLAGVIFAALCVAAIYGLTVGSYTPGDGPQQTTGATR